MADLWKMGQLRPGDRVRFLPVTMRSSAATAAEQDREIATLQRSAPVAAACDAHSPAHARQRQPCNPRSSLAARQPRAHAAICIRRSGEDNLLVEFGAAELDLVLRFQVQALL